MSLKDKLESVMQQANSYLENANLKEKVLEMKDKTVDRVKGVDNPDHYTAPTGFELFTVPVAMSTPEITRTLEKIEPFHLKEQDKIIDAYIRMLSLLENGEEIKDAIIASMKRLYLIVWTNKDRLLIVHKEHYKIYKREEMRLFKAIKTSTFGLTFQLNQYEFIGSEKAKTYCFIRSYCHEETQAYSFTPYLSFSRNLNYYERFKYEKLAKENDATIENKELCTLFESFEYPLVSVFASFFQTTYILALTTSGKLYLISPKEYTILKRTDIKNIVLMNKGVFSHEFYMDNYYFTGSGPEMSVLKLIQYINDPVKFEEAKNAFYKDNRAMVEFPFQGATAYQTPGGEAIVISASKTSFLVCHSMNRVELHPAKDFSHYELLEDLGVSKEAIQEKQLNRMNRPATKTEAIQNFDKMRVLLYLKGQEEYELELPFMLLKKTVYQQFEEVTNPSAEVTKELLDVLDTFTKLE